MGLVQEWQTKQYTDNVLHLSQQKGSVLEQMCRKENMTGSIAKFFDKIGTTTALVRGGKNSDTPNVDMDHLRRRLSVASYNWATLVDNVEKMKQIHSLESEYLKAAVMAFGRRKDGIILNALEASAWEGEEGTTAVPLPTTQRIASVKSNALSTLNVNTLRDLKLMFDAKDIDPMLARYFFCTPEEIYAMLGELEVTNYDYNNVKALAEGKVDTFMGFKFVTTNLINRGAQVVSGQTMTFDKATGMYTGVAADANNLAPAATAKRCFAVAGDAVILGYGEDIKTRMSERDDKNYNAQVYVEMTLGGMRLEDEKVIQVYTKAK